MERNLAKISNFEVAGKTGTSHKTSFKGDMISKYIASFAGIAPLRTKD